MFYEYNYRQWYVDRLHIPPFTVSDNFQTFINQQHVNCSLGRLLYFADHLHIPVT